MRFGFSNEFLARNDGWPLIRERYRLPQTSVRGLDHDLAYRALMSGSIDATDLYSADAEIAFYDLRVLEDDLHVFPQYRAVYLYRAELNQRRPSVPAVLAKLAGRIDEKGMVAMSERAKLERVAEATVAADFLKSTLGIHSIARISGPWQSLGRYTAEHLYLVGISLAAAIAVGVPLGVVAGKLPGVGRIVLGVVAVIYTIPSLALLVFMIPLLGIGAKPAIVALFLYSLLPIVRNTSAGLRHSAAGDGVRGGAGSARMDATAPHRDADGRRFDTGRNPDISGPQRRHRHARRFDRRRGIWRAYCYGDSPGEHAADSVGRDPCGVTGAGGSGIV